MMMMLKGKKDDAEIFLERGANQNGIRSIAKRVTRYEIPCINTKERFIVGKVKLR